MMNSIQTSYTDAQVSVWLRGLLTIAWADEQFDSEEQAIIAYLTQELAATANLGLVETISSTELVAVLGKDSEIAENFMRTAVMVAIADGLYSASEDEVLHEFCTALGIDPALLDSLRQTLASQVTPVQAPEPDKRWVRADLPKPEVLKPIQDWLDQLEIVDPRVARFLCHMIPAQCPFERDVTLFGHKLIHIPPMCKINPLYEQLVGLRFRALSYLADECQEDVTRYC